MSQFGKGWGKEAEKKAEFKEFTSKSQVRKI